MQNPPLRLVRVESIACHPYSAAQMKGTPELRHFGRLLSIPRHCGVLSTDCRGELDQIDCERRMLVLYQKCVATTVAGPGVPSITTVCSNSWILRLCQPRGASRNAAFM